mgnify:CR=1 FL=1
MSCSVACIQIIQSLHLHVVHAFALTYLVNFVIDRAGRSKSAWAPGCIACPCKSAVVCLAIGRLVVVFVRLWPRPVLPSRCCRQRRDDQTTTLIGRPAYIYSFLYYLRPILLVFLSFCLLIFDHSSYSKNFEIIIYFVCHLLYYQKYFTYDLSFFIIALIFQIKRMVKHCK